MIIMYYNILVISYNVRRMYKYDILVLVLKITFQNHLERKNKTNEKSHEILVVCRYNIIYTWTGIYYVQ